MLGILTNTLGRSDWWTMKENRCLSLMMVGITNREKGKEKRFGALAVKRLAPSVEDTTAI